MTKQLELLDFMDFYKKVGELRSKKVLPTIDNCIPWLYENGLTAPANGLMVRNGRDFVAAQDLLYSVAIKRV